MFFRFEDGKEVESSRRHEVQAWLQDAQRYLDRTASFPDLDAISEDQERRG